MKVKSFPKSPNKYPILSFNPKGEISFFTIIFEKSLSETTVIVAFFDKIMKKIKNK